MRYITALTIAALLSTSCAQQTQPFKYTTNGVDWKDSNEDCNKPGQSPIKL